MNTQIKTLSNAVACADQSCGELILKPETAGEYAHNAEIVSGLREQVAAITAMIKAMSTGVDIAPPASFIGSVLWNRHDVGWWPNWIPFDERGPVTEIHDASELLRDAGVVAPIDGLVYCVCKLPTCTIGICVFGDTGYEFQIPFMSTGVDIAPLPDPPSEIYVPLSSLSADEFITLVRAGKVQVETPDGDTNNAMIDRAGEGWAHIGWNYELIEDGEWDAYHDYTAIDKLTTLQQDGNKVFANGATFIIEQP
jgi:hypothetical protein